MPTKATAVIIARAVRLSELPQPSADRLSSATDPAAWVPLCEDPRAALWMAWNIEHDAWYRAEDLEQIGRRCAGAPDALHGPKLLVHLACEIAGARELVRAMTPEEQALLPGEGLNHVAASRYSYRYDLVPESAWDEGSLPSEMQPVCFGHGQRIRLQPRRPEFIWVTFDCSGRTVPRDDADAVLCRLGLAWSPDDEVLRITVPLLALRGASRRFALPTIFDSINTRTPERQCPDWRARPSAEHREHEPWGHTRHLRDDGPSFPEIIVDLSVLVLDAESLGKPTLDWSKRAFLERSCPT